MKNFSRIDSRLSVVEKNRIIRKRVPSLIESLPDSLLAQLLIESEQCTLSSKKEELPSLFDFIESIGGHEDHDGERLLVVRALPRNVNAEIVKRFRLQHFPIQKG